MVKRVGWGSQFHILTTLLALAHHLRALNLASVPYLPKVSHSTLGPSPRTDVTLLGAALLRP